MHIVSASESMKRLIVSKSIKISAPASKIWEVLTNTDFTKQYMFGCEAVSEWSTGSALIWKGAKDGKTYVKGNVVGIVPGRFLQYTTFDPNAAYEDKPSNYTTVTYEIKEKENHTVLSVSQGDFAEQPEAERRYLETTTGWESVLPKIKELAEK